MRPKALVLAIALGFLAACGGGGSGEEMISAQYRVLSVDGKELRTDSIAEGVTAKLAEGEYAMIGMKKYVGGSNGGELTVSKGRLRTKNVNVSSP